MAPSDAQNAAVQAQRVRAAVTRTRRWAARSSQHPPLDISMAFTMFILGILAWGAALSIAAVLGAVLAGRALRAMTAHGHGRDGAQWRARVALGGQQAERLCGRATRLSGHAEISAASLIVAGHEAASKLTMPSGSAASHAAAACSPMQRQLQEGEGAGRPSERASQQPALEQTLKLALESLQAERQERQTAEQQQRDLERSLQAERQGRQAAEQQQQALERSLQAERQARQAAEQQQCALEQSLHAERQGRQAAERALQQAVEAATARTGFCQQVPLHGAAQRGDVQEVRLILAIAPQTAAVTAACGTLPFHLAAGSGNTGVETMELLLDVAPAALTATNSAGMTALHHAAERYGGEWAVGWLLQRAPQLAEVQDNHGALPLHAAARWLFVSSMRQLLAAAPLTATTRDRQGRTPLHAAAASPFRAVDDASGAALQLLFEAAPTAARALDGTGCTPLELLLSNPERAGTAQQLRLHSPDRTLALLRAVRQPGNPDLPERLSAALPLTALEWASLPLASLPTALPIALAHSPAQARQLVLQLPSLERRRLRTFALCLTHTQRHTDMALPQAILQSILVQACCLLFAG